MRYVCSICGFVYDEDKEQVPFDSLPDTWKCPLCGAPKSAFEPEKVPEAVPAAAPAPVIDADMKQLNAGQLAALFSNLARGCEKQYKPEEAALFAELASYYTSVTPAPESASLEELSALFKEDINDRYPAVKAIAQQEGDRGTQRVCVWGEKVTRMLSSLADRYLKEGEDMLRDTEVWVCTVCGFVYIGKNPPELCPVCKVPDWKFEKVEGRKNA
ncbi:MAG: rubredoxin [Oscillospiraceae bacterium]|nr:rubredoxin [Oscillospiraceae bacterium]MDO5137228.1 rubredoxin [Oscillospiraceae bacterium]